MDGVTRKLADRQGATLVFALVALFILSMFSAEVMLESISALQNSVLLRNSEKAYASVNSAARLIQDSLKAAPDMAFVMGEGTVGTWESLSKSDNPIVQNVVIAALNSTDPVEFRWSVKSDARPELEDAFTDIPLTVTAEYCLLNDLRRYSEKISLCTPTITVRFEHSDYQMTMRIMARSVKAVEDAEGYLVKFAENDELDIALSLGAS